MVTCRGLSRCRPSSWLEPTDAWLLVPLFQQKHRMMGLCCWSRPRIPSINDLGGHRSVKDPSRLAAAIWRSRMPAGRWRRLDSSRVQSPIRFCHSRFEKPHCATKLGGAQRERHHNNPEFMRDAIKTVDHAVGKMSRLLSQLKNSGSAQSEQIIDLGASSRSCGSSDGAGANPHL